MQVIRHVGWKLELWIFGACQKIMTLCVECGENKKYYRKAGSLLNCFHFVFKKNAAPLIQREVPICVAVTWLLFLELSLFYSVREVQKALPFTGTDQRFPLSA